MKNSILLISLMICLIFTGCEKNVDNTCPYSIMVDDNIYYCTEETPEDIKDVKIIGKITSVVPENKMPSKNSQANIGSVDASYGKYKDDIVVLINDEWVLFELRDNDISSDNNQKTISHKKEKTVPLTDNMFHVGLSFAGTIIEENPSYLIVEPNEDEDVRKISDRLYVKLKDEENRDYLYGEGRKVVIYYTASPKSAVFEIMATTILTDGYEEFELLPVASETKEKTLILTSEDIDALDSFPHDAKSDLYYYGLNHIDVTVNEETISLLTALESGKITLNGIIKKANIDADNGICKKEMLKDGGTSIYKYNNYSIIKYHTLDGNRDVYIGSSEMDTDVCNQDISLPEISSQPCLPADEWGLMLTVVNADTSGATLNFLQRGGNPSGDLQFGAEYIIEKKSNDTWIPVEYIFGDEPITWHAIAYQIPKDDTCEFEIDWEFLYGNLETGVIYRIGKEVMDFRKTGDYDKKMYYSEFAIID